MSMLGAHHAREKRLLTRVALDPLAYASFVPSPLERRALLRLRQRGLVDFWVLGPMQFGEWTVGGSEPYRVMLTPKGRKQLSSQAETLLLLGGGS